jgi:type I restriction enzyme, S subunit
MNQLLKKIGIKDESFELVSVRQLIAQKVLEKPLDGNHGEIHPKTEDFVAEGVPFIMATDVNNGQVNYPSCNFIRAKQADSLRKGFARNGDVLLTHKATIGRTAIVKYEKHPYVMLTPQVTYYRVRDRQRLNNRYLRHYFDSELFQKTLHLWADSGSTRAYLGITEQQKLPIILPPFEKQMKIAAILSAYDELIENNCRRIALLEKLAEEIYREWFVRFRFLSHEKLRVVKGVPQGWTLVKLDQAFKFTGGGTPSKEVNRYWNDGDVNWFTPSDITGADGIFLERSGDQCSEEGVNNSSARMFPAYSVMLTSRATIGAIGINTTPACTNQGFITCIPNEKYPLPYLYHWLKLAKPHFELLAGGATFAELTKGTFKRIEILTPPEPIITEFTRIESPLFASIDALLRTNRKLIETRNKLLPRLISGKLSIENLNIEFPPNMIEESSITSDTTTHG